MVGGGWEGESKVVKLEGEEAAGGEYGVELVISEGYYHLIYVDL